MKDERDQPCNHHRSGLSGWWLTLLLAWLAWLLWSVIRLFRGIDRDRNCADGQAVPPWAYRQPDPLIYSQTYLQSLGLAVTWDNPDIHLERPGTPGVPVDAHQLQPDTTYTVVARIWNGSSSAPAVDLPVRFSYLTFGIGTVRTLIGTANVDLGVKGSSTCPALAPLAWRTPATPGHYCLQVELLWADDENPANNLGQHNTDVVRLNSPRGRATFPLRNASGQARVLRLEADRYAIPSLEDCEQGEARPDERLTRHLRSAWPLAPGWQVSVQPPEARLGPNETVDITVNITAPDGFHGREAINVHAFSDSELVGGVTLYAEGSG